uniref:PhiKZ-like internal head protein n=1 Tax=Pantoea phage Survivor TaxID=3232176 RepID=A0AAU8KZF2_9CAUD
MSSLDLIFASIAGNESAEVDLDKVEHVAEVTAEEAAEAVVEAEIKEIEADVSELEKDVASTETTVEALEEKVEELEEHIDGMEAMASGAAPFNSALFAYHFNKGSKLAARFGAPVEHVGAESFADASTANLAAFAGLEGMKEVAVKAGGAIKKFFVQLYNQFIALFTGLFNRLGGLQKKAGVVKTSVANGKVKEGKVALSGGAANLLDAKGSAGSAIPAIVSAIGDVTQIGGHNPLAGVQRVISDLGKMGSKSSTNAGADVAGVKIKVGATTVVIVEPKDEKALSKTNWSVSVDGGAALKEVDALEKGALSALCDSVASNAAKLQSAKLSSSSLTKQRDAAIAAAEAKAKKAGGEGDAAQGEDKGSLAGVRAGHTAILKLSEKAVKFGGDILAAQLQFVQAHLGGKAAAPAEEKKDDKAEEKKED